VVAVATDKLVLEAELDGGTHVQAADMSEGLLYCLAFLAMPYLAPTTTLILEEPENGLHPARIAEVIGMLRGQVDLTGVQVLIATHSPLVLNELKPEEVTVLTRSSVVEGTKATPINATPNFERRASVYSLGELWLAYCDGKDESPLFNEARR
jgi:predicted ATPase